MLLEHAGVECVVQPADIDENRLPGESPHAYAGRLAVEKADAVASRNPAKLVLGADTIVVAHTGEILEKPADLADARRMLRLLSSQRHTVMTGVSLRRLHPPVAETWVCETQIWFNALTADDITGYLGAVDVLDKAGSYAIQDHGDKLVAAINGLRSNVVGLPVEEVLERLRMLNGAL